MATLTEPLPDYHGGAGVAGTGIVVAIGNNDTGASANSGQLYYNKVFRGLVSQTGGTVSLDWYGYTSTSPFTDTVTLSAGVPMDWGYVARVRSGPTDLRGIV